MAGNERKKKVGVRALAKTTGLSVATISRVLNNSETVSPKTREKVQQAIVQAGYTPNPAARALATQRTRTIGAVVPTISDSIFSRFLNSVEVELAKHSFALVIATSEFDSGNETRRARDLINLGAEGLILSGSAQEDELLNLVRSANIPTLCSSVHETTNGLPAVGYDNRLIAGSAISYLAELGHRSIAVIHGPTGNNDRTELRKTGAGQAAAKHKVELAFFEQTLSVEGGAEGAQEIFRSGNETTAILCFSDVLALGAMFESQRQGITVPHDVSLMGFDDLYWSSLSSPSLTTIHLPTGRMGTAIASALVANLDQGQSIRSEVLEARIIKRGSTAAPNPRHHARKPGP